VEKISKPETSRSVISPQELLYVAQRFKLSHLIQQIDNLFIKFKELEDIELDYSLSKNIETLINNPLYSDVVLVIEEGKFRIHAHRIILATRAIYFRKLFFGFMKETQEKEIQFPECKYDAFLVVLQYLYSGLVNVAPDLAMTCFEMASLFGIVELYKICESLICEAISVNNVLEFLEWADINQATKLKRECFAFLTQDLSEVTGFVDFSVKHQQLMKEWLC